MPDRGEITSPDPDPDWPESGALNPDEDLAGDPADVDDE
jgi:hypothetical protein